MAQFNLNKSEDHIAKEVMAYTYDFKDTPRFTVLPCLVELIHFSRKKMSPNDIGRNLDALQVAVQYLKFFHFQVIKIHHAFASWTCHSALASRESSLFNLDQFYLNLKNTADIQQHRQAWEFAALLDTLECSRRNA